MAEIRLFYREAIAQDRDTLRAQALATRAAMHAKKDAFAKFLKQIEGKPREPRTRPRGGTNTQNPAATLLDQLKALGIPQAHEAP